MKPNPGSFTPYLEYANSNVPSKEAPAAAVAPSPNAAPSTSLTILEILSRQVQRTLPIWDLQSLSGMDAVRFREALRSLRSLDYVTVEGASLDEVVRLTDKGADAASLAR